MKGIGCTERNINEEVLEIVQEKRSSQGTAEKRGLSIMIRHDSSLKHYKRANGKKEEEKKQEDLDEVISIT